MNWIHSHHFCIGLLADGATFAGAILLARDSFLRLSDLKEKRTDEAFRERFQRLHLTDAERKAALRSVQWTFAGSCLLIFGFGCQLVLRFGE